MDPTDRVITNNYCMYPTCICAFLLQSQIQVGEKL